MDKIKIGGKNRPISFGMAALALFCRKTGISLQELESKFQQLDLMDSIQLITCGLEDGARKSKQSFEFEWEDVADWLDKRPEAMGDAMGILNQSFDQKEVKTESEGK